MRAALFAILLVLAVFVATAAASQAESDAQDAELLEAVEAMADTSAGCALQRYSNPRFIGSSVVASPSFRPWLDKLAGYASQCGVKIYVTSSYRSNANVSGAIVKPASRSNHMVGMAIDMNLQSSSGAMCNSSCLSRISSAAQPFRCFIAKVQATGGGLRWGQSFNDPVHIDYALNLSSPSGWDSQYQATQKAFQQRCF